MNLNLTNTQKNIIFLAQSALKTQLPDNGGRVPLKDKILYALRDLDRHEQGLEGVRHKTAHHALRALKRYLKETAR